MLEMQISRMPSVVYFSLFLAQSVAAGALRFVIKQEQVELKEEPNVVGMTKLPNYRHDCQHFRLMVQDFER
jgi:hypothetical protein